MINQYLRVPSKLGSNIFAQKIINITPDSFSDGKKYLDKETLLIEIQEQIKWGVHYFDFGAQSTAPKSAHVDRVLEKKRFDDYFFPLFRTHKDLFKNATLSIDTYRAETFDYVSKNIWQEAPSQPLIWNDISGKLDKSVYALLEHPQMRYCLCHNNSPDRESAYLHKEFILKNNQDVVLTLLDFFKDAEFRLMSKSLLSKVIFDPGFGFSKGLEQNLYLLDHLADLIKKFSVERQWLIGLSRKSFLQHLVREKWGVINNHLLDSLHDVYIWKIKSQLISHSIIVRSHQTWGTTALLAT